jgi:oxygen-independent coproporphyrinogen-3 oxidase
MLAFGISAIGKVGAAYVANVKTLDEYYERLDANELPVMRGVVLGADDLLRRNVIQKLMCNFELDFAAVGAEYGVSFADYFAPDLAALAPLAADGLVELDERSVRVTPRGRLLVRTVAMQFDRYLREAQVKAQYSKVI